MQSSPPRTPSSDPRRRPDHRLESAPDPVRGSASSDRRIDMQILMQATHSLMDVLTTISRVGGRLESVNASQANARLVVVAREPVAARLPRLIDQLIGVLEVTERTGTTEHSAAEAMIQ